MNRPGSFSAGFFSCRREPFQLRKHRQQHGEEAGGTAHNIGDGFCHEDPVRAKPEEVRQEKRQRDDENGLAEQGEENGLLFLVQRFERGLSRILEPLENKSKKVNVKSRNRILQNRVV